MKGRELFITGKYKQIGLYMQIRKLMTILEGGLWPVEYMRLFVKPEIIPTVVYLFVLQLSDKI